MLLWKERPVAQSGTTSTPLCQLSARSLKKLGLTLFYLHMVGVAAWLSGSVSDRTSLSRSAIFVQLKHQHEGAPGRAEVTPCVRMLIDSPTMCILIFIIVARNKIKKLPMALHFINAVVWCKIHKKLWYLKHFTLYSTHLIMIPVTALENSSSTISCMHVFYIGDDLLLFLKSIFCQMNLLLSIIHYLSNIYLC